MGVPAKARVVRSGLEVSSFNLKMCDFALVYNLGYLYCTWNSQFNALISLEDIFSSSREGNLLARQKYTHTHVCVHI